MVEHMSAQAIIVRAALLEFGVVRAHALVGAHPHHLSDRPHILAHIRIMSRSASMAEHRIIMSAHMRDMSAQVTIIMPIRAMAISMQRDIIRSHITWQSLHMSMHSCMAVLI